MRRFHLIVGSLFISLAFFPPATTSSTPPRPNKSIALTFDDGPHPEGTLRLRAVLNQYDVKATFFIVGKVAVQYPDLVRLLSRDGHEIANHTWSHSDIRSLSPARIWRELEETRRLILSLTGKNTRLFRTPGSSEPYLRKRFRVPGPYRLVLWDIHSLDQEGLTPDEIAERVEGRAKDGDIVIMHNGFQNTVKALEMLIPRLKERGFEFKTVSQILEREMVSARLYERHLMVSEEAL